MSTPAGTLAGVSMLNTVVRVAYTGTGVETQFATTFRFLDNAHLVVEKSTDGGTVWVAQTLDTHYSVIGADAPEPGGTVTLLVALGNGHKLRITRQTPRTQPVEWSNQGQFSQKVLERELDRRCMVQQEQAAEIAELQAGNAPVTLASSKVQTTFVVLDPVETTFPRNIACVGTPSGVSLMRVEDLTDATQKYYGLGEVGWDTPALNQFRLTHVPGLVPGHNTRITLLVITL